MAKADFRGAGGEVFGTNLKWVGFVASRYVSKGHRISPAPVLAILGISTGVLALTVIIAVMNGFQLGFIESILEISSYHVRVEALPPGGEGDIRRRIRELPGIISAVPFREFHGLLRGEAGGGQAAVIRGLPEDALAWDPGMAAKLEFEAGSFDIRGERSLLLGAELARRLRLYLGDEVTLISVSGLFPEEAEAADSLFTVTGIFRSGFYEYDLGWGFISLADAEKIAGTGDKLILGIKLKNRWQDNRARELIRQLLGDAFPLSTWRDYNRAFFSALRTEKLLMFVLLGLIFIVVGLNIFQAQRRAVLERREEIGLLRALGAADRAVRLIFIWDGFIIGFTGATAGTALGLLIAFRISAFFTLLEGLINGFIGMVNGIAGFFGGAYVGEFAVFSPAVFYIKEIPSRVIPQEVFLIFMFGFLSALLAAWFASGKISQTRPAEVLRYE
ncbi:MAG: ABC transporter permease [Treponema sp.]|jgi:lipoprotein-releasing system permease protein|nr:ABC transporter permease [Treponema sp.]